MRWLLVSAALSPSVERVSSRVRAVRVSSAILIAALMQFWSLMLVSFLFELLTVMILSYHVLACLFRWAERQRVTGTKRRRRWYSLWL